MMSKMIPKLNIGERYGLFTIIGTVIKEMSNKRQPYFRQLYYNCKCDCGNIREIPKFNLISGASNSCGCIPRGKKTLPPGEATFNEKYAICRNTAKNRGLEFDLSILEFKNTVTKNCFYCGESPKKYNRYLKKDGSRKKHETISNISQLSIDRAWVEINTVDRLDSNLGYTVNNCVPACWPCNEAKMDSNVDEFISRVYKIVLYQEKLKQILNLDNQ